MALTIMNLTPAAAQQNLQNDGLDTLGLTTARLSPRWANSTPQVSDYDSTALTLQISGDVRAPFTGIREFTYAPAQAKLAAAVSETATSLTLAGGSGKHFPSPVAGAAVVLILANSTGTKREIVACTARAADVLTVVRGHEGSTPQSFAVDDTVTLRVAAGARTSQFLGANGAPLEGSCVALRFHPQAVLRLQQLMAVRYQAPGGQPIRPVPQTLVVRGVEGFTTPRWCRAGEIMTNQGELPQITGAVSFHGRRGQIIDPIYVAALFTDLLAAFPGLLPDGASALDLTGTGGITPIANLASGTLLHVVDLHGGNYRKSFSLADMVTIDAGNAVTGTVPASGLVILNPGERLSGAAGDAGRLRWGWATNGIMSRTPLSPPLLPPGGSPPAALARDFLRVAVVDTRWALLGNRNVDEILDVGGDDQRIPVELQPEIRDQVIIDYLADGPDMLAEVSRVINRQQQAMVLAVSPDIDGTMATPNAPGAAAHWPQFPAPNPNTTLSGKPDLENGLNAAFTAGHDVLVTINAGVLPDGVHVRIYPQQFVEIAAIAAEPSFLRADGGAALVSGGNPVKILLINPFALQSGEPLPSPANLTMDIVVTPRQGKRLLYAAVSTNVGPGPADTTDTDSFADPLQLLGVMVPQTVSIAESPLFGIPRTTPPPPAPPPGDFLALIASLATESSPRQAPRLPTMARFDTLMVTGTTGPGTPQPTGSLLWDAVLSGGRLSRESRSALHESGNPGNPAGPDLHAPGVRVTGALGYDVAMLALHRVQPIIPLPSTAGGNPGWLFVSLDNKFDPPDDSANNANTGIGVLLQSVAVACETPLLSSLTPPPPGLTVQQMVDNAASSLGLTPPVVTVTIDNEPRIQRDIRREFFVSKHGLRDAQWSLRRALNEARELVYIESPQFSRTARPSGTNPPAHEVDLVTELATRLGSQLNLMVLVCIPREPDFSTKFKGWWRQHYADRTEAVSILKNAAPDRVAVFHPVGFPGRTAFIRSTSVIVDDVWCLVGSTHFRRRGMTFDGSSAIASFDRQLADGYSRKVRNYRRALMAAKLKVAPPAAGAPPSADWVRLSRPASAFDLVADLLAQGGLGRIHPLYPGPSDTSIKAVGSDTADPDGSTSDNFLTIFAGMLNEAGD